jgi:putative glutamine amidotransferase
MAPPLIGITTFREQHKDGFPLISLAEAYIQAVSQVGGIPVLVPLGLPEEQLNDLSLRLDGVIFSGGGDIHPDRYWGESHPKVGSVDTDRDRVELALVHATIEMGIPFLGICRGLQTVNVALGGSLYTHLPEQVPGLLHPPYDGSKPRDLLAHPVAIDPGSLLHGVLGELQVEVNSLHHQGVKRLAPGLAAAGHSPDGLVEAAELGDYPFGLAVQWHPEWLISHRPMRALFAAFVEAAKS